MKKFNIKSKIKIHKIYDLHYVFLNLWNSLWGISKLIHTNHFSFVRQKGIESTRYSYKMVCFYLSDFYWAFDCN